MTAIGLTACGEKEAADTHRISTPIHVNVDIVDFAKISKQGAAVVAKLTETDRITGFSSSHVSVQIGNISDGGIGFELPQPAQLNKDVLYGISVELKTGNSRPSFSAWYPLDLEHYDGIPLVARLFPADSTVLINYQIMAYSCDALALEIATDGDNLWLNANGAGYFLKQTTTGVFSGNYAEFNLDTGALTLGTQQYQCQRDGSKDRIAKLRFGGAKLRGINREAGWTISIYDNHINYVTERGFKSAILALQSTMPLNDNWAITTTNNLRIERAPFGQCEQGLQAIAIIDENDISHACAEKLR